MSRPKAVTLLVRRVIWKAASGDPGDGFHGWTLGQPWEEPRQGAGSPPVLDLGSRLPLCSCAPMGLGRWAFGGLMAPVTGLGVARHGTFGLPLLPLSL